MEHSIQWQNHCPYPIWVDVQGGEQTTIAGIKSVNNPEGKNTTYGGCACMLDGAKEKSIGCNPTTKCDGVACEGPNHEGNYFKCNTGVPLVDGGGFKLDADLRPGAQTTHTSVVPMLWQGAFWGRTHCTGTDDDLDCDWMTCRVVTDGKGKLQCGGIGVTVPATKGEINFDENSVTTYDVSIVDGFNVPMKIEIVPGTGKKVPLDDKHSYFDCGPAGTSTDLLPLFNATGLASRLIKKTDAGEMAALWSACSISSAPNPQDPRWEEYCCKGVYGSAQDYEKNGNHKCDPTTWPKDLNTAAFFHQYLKGSYSYAYDDDASTFQCRNADSDTGVSVLVTFCGENEPPRITLPGQDTHTHVPVIVPTPVPTQTPVPLNTIAPVQTPVAPYNPSSGGLTF
ncbi:MAG: thaumatin family protein [Methanomicrobiales archaeon]|nr:thaumatin family protein [Methanomicrobiales archaeon]